MAEGLIGSRFQSDLFQSDLSQKVEAYVDPFVLPPPRLQQPVSSKDDKFHGR